MAFSDHPTSKKMTGKASNKESVPLHLQVRTPEFEGGQDALDAFIQKNLDYPALAERNNVEGTVIIRFKVLETGIISDIEVEKPLGMGCDEAAIALVKSMPDWTPGVQGGRAITTSVRLPVQFRLY